MDACRLWGAIVLLLLGTTAVASTLHDKQERHGEGIQKDQAHVADNASREQRQALLDKPISILFAPLDAMKSTRQDVKEDRSDLQRAQEQRALQSSCTEGDSFAITSSVFPLTEGCFSDLGRTTGDGKIVYESALFLVASLSAFTTTSSETLGSYWVVVDSTSDTSITGYYYCYSMENSTALLHPADATWVCDVDGDGQDEVAEHSQFSTTCGCSTTTATATTATMTDIVTTTATVTDSTNATFDDSTTATTDSESMSTTTTSDIDTTTTSDITSSPTTADNNTSSTSQSDITTSDVEPAATCAEGESFTINSTVLPDLNGCYFDTGTLIEGEIVYTESGNRFTDQNMVHASTDIRWIVGVSRNDADCTSVDQATDVHPAEVDTWTCTLGSESRDVTEEEFSVTCGCSGGSLSVVLSTLITFGVGVLATTLLLVGI